MAVTSTPDIIVSNTDISVTGSGPTSQNPDVVALDNGTYVVSWHDLSRAGNVWPFDSPSFQVRNADGSAAGDVLKIERAVDDLPFSLNYSVQPDGRIFATWQEAIPNSLQKQIFAQAFDVTGQPLGAKFPVSASASANITGFTVIALDNGDVGISWLESKAYDAVLQRGGLFGKITVFDTRGHLKSSKTVSGEHDYIDDLKIVAVPGGKLIASWTDHNTTTTEDSLKIQMLNANGSVAGSVHLLSTPADRNRGQAPEVTVLANGALLATWSVYSQFNDVDVLFQRLDKQGKPLGTPTIVSDVALGGFDPVDVVSMDDGRYVLVFERKIDASNPYSKEEVLLQVYGSGGQKIGDVSKINEAYPDDARNFSVAAMSDGKLVVTWQSKEGTYFGGGKGGIFAHNLYAIRQSIVDVGPAPPPQLPDPDVFAGSAEGDKLIGNDNANMIDGREGDDVISGGLGADKLIGGDGRDTASYFSDEGVTASLQDPAINKGAAEGDTYLSIEDLFGSASGDDRLTGNEEANGLRGYGGNDILIGAGGRDELVGGDGGDKLKGGFGADLLNGGAGSDRFVYFARGEGGDTVRGFGADDYFVFEGSAFGLGSYHGRLKSWRFDSGKDNVANDTIDRFIFRSTDRTLWFDADGKGGEAAIKIADLTSNFDLKASDILIV